ncbi:MAG: DUF1127 domain-containing protein [Rhodobacteraceae bacterium]|nr:DUF1127 domain-containing protein [Paracoccaceae bacterium]
MTDCMTQNCGSLVAQKPNLLSRIATRFKTRMQQRQDRAAFQHLLALDPDILKDIGVSRGDVVWANNLPIEVNAACALEKEVRHRKPHV